MGDDTDLLRQFIRDGSAPAFRMLVERHLGLVQATALRLLAGDTHAAQDVTQMVFTDLARKAARLPPGVLLGGWLHHHTYFLALQYIRTENRRRARERTAMEIQALDDNPANEAQWTQLAPVLDEALHSLGAEDREAIVLRYLQQHDVRSVGLALGLSENTAQQRIGRALEKLRAILTRRGVTLTAIMLATTLDGQTTPPVSTAKAAAVSAAAVSGAVALTGFSLTAFIATMTISQKLALGVATLLLIAGVAVTLQQHTAEIPAPAPKPVASAPAKPTTATIAPPTAQPVTKPAAATAPTAATSDPQTNPNTAIDDILAFLAAGDLNGMMKKYVPVSPDDGSRAAEDAANGISPAKRAQMQEAKRQAMQQMMAARGQELIQSYTAAFQSVKGQTPKMNDAGDEATFHADNQPPGESDLVLIKIDGRWYLKSQ